MRRARFPIAAAAAALVVVAGAAAAPPAPPPATPNDPGWPGEWGLRLMNFPDLWPQATAAHPVIATIDTGVDPTFPDLQDSLVPGWNVLDDDAATDDEAGHGTDVALVIAADQDNDYGLTGACPACRVMPVKVSDDGDAEPQTIAAGIRWAVDHGARIISVSLAAPGDADPAEQAAVDYAGARGAVVLAATGNDGSTTPSYPAALRGVVSVTATDENDALYPWSTRGSWVDLAAPGCEYGEDMCGTSYTPPLVAAAIGLLTAAAPGVTPVQAVNALRATAVHVDGIDGGRIDVRAAAEELGIPAVAPAPATQASTETQTQAVRTQASEQQVSIQSGTFGRKFRKTLTVAGGPLTVLLNRAHASACSMSLRSGTSVYLTWRTTPNELDISTRVDAGRYVLTVRCTQPRRRTYSLFVNARFPVR